MLPLILDYLYNFDNCHNTGNKTLPNLDAKVLSQYCEMVQSQIGFLIIQIPWDISKHLFFFRKFKHQLSCWLGPCMSPLWKTAFWFLVSMSWFYLHLPSLKVLLPLNINCLWIFSECFGSFNFLISTFFLSLISNWYFDK